MIFIISKGLFEKKGEKLVAERDYLIIDGTGATSSSMEELSGAMKVMGFDFPDLLIKKPDDAQSKYGYGIEFGKKQKKSLKKHKKSPEFIQGAAAAVELLIERKSDINIFIVVKDKKHKKIGNTIAEAINELVEDSKVEVAICYGKEDFKEGKKILRKSLKGKELDKLNKVVKSIKKKKDLD